MTAPKRSFKTEFGRFYKHPMFQPPPVTAASALASIGQKREQPSGPYAPNPSITNIKDMMDKKFLPPYYARLVAEYAIANLDNLKALQAKWGDAYAIGQLKAVPNVNTAAAVGDEVHAAIDSFVKWKLNQGGVSFGIPEFSTKTAAAMFAQFLWFDDQYKPEYLRSEYTVWSYKHGYAGTGDLMWLVDGEIWVVDTKSGKNAWPETAMQTSAIANADVILNEDDSESPMTVTQAQGILHVRPRSVKLIKLERTDEAFHAFLACKTLFDWKRNHAEHTMLEPLRFERPKGSTDNTDLEEAA